EEDSRRTGPALDYRASKGSWPASSLSKAEVAISGKARSAVESSDRADVGGGAGRNPRASAPWHHPLVHWQARVQAADSSRTRSNSAAGIGADPDPGAKRASRGVAHRGRQPHLCPVSSGQARETLLGVLADRGEVRQEEQAVEFLRHESGGPHCQHRDSPTGPFRRLYQRRFHGEDLSPVHPTA